MCSACALSPPAVVHLPLRHAAARHVQAVALPAALAAGAREHFERHGARVGISFEVLAAGSSLDAAMETAEPFFRVELPSGEHLLHRMATNTRKHPLQFGREVGACVDTYAGYHPSALTRTSMFRGPPYCAHGLRVPPSCVLYVLEAQGSLPPGPHAPYVRGTRTSLG